MGAGAASVPGALVAVADRLGRLAAEMLHQAAAVGQQSGAGLEFIEFVARAAVMSEMGGEKDRTPERVKIRDGQIVGCKREQRFHDPAGM